MCYKKSNRAIYLPYYNSIAVEKLYFSSFLGFRGGAISEVGFSTGNSPEVHSLGFTLPRLIVPLMPTSFFGPGHCPPTARKMQRAKNVEARRRRRRNVEVLGGGPALFWLASWELGRGGPAARPSALVGRICGARARRISGAPAGAIGLGLGCA
jgi:hypothetical protein